jgi:hypothetical protein
VLLTVVSCQAEPSGRVGLIVSLAQVTPSEGSTTSTSKSARAVSAAIASCVPATQVVIKSISVATHHA